MSFDINDFHAYLPSKRRFSTSELRISKRCISFNFASAAELRYPQKVCILVTDDGSKLLLSEWKDTYDPAVAVPFFDRSSKRTKRVTLTDIEFVRLIREKLGWYDDLPRSVNGVLYAEENILLFNLQRALAKQKDSRRGFQDLSDYPTAKEALSQARPVRFALPPATPLTPGGHSNPTIVL